ncbi:C1 family peptidase [uncultured Croceitalea sp.]|uniref:C1 family peptidase n=1 Tax=uncultured Croceitalea sp. TaxID=1798908 RepID=UPI0033067EC1
MKKIIFVSITFFISFYTYDSFGQAEFSSGVKLLSKEQSRKIPLLRIKPRGILELPERVDLSSYFPKPGDQGRLNSCTAWATGYALKSFQERRELRNYSLEFSPSFIYNQIYPEETCSDGVYIEDALNFLSNNGCSLLYEFPYDEDCAKKPNENVIKRAKTYKILSYQKVLDKVGYFQDLNISETKKFLVDSIPIVMALQLDKEAWKNTYGNRSDVNSPFVWNLYRGNCDACYHAMVCVGYDEKIGALKFMDSRGVDRGNNGFMWISYEVAKRAAKVGYIATDMVNGATDFLVNDFEPSNKIVESFDDEKQRKEYSVVLRNGRYYAVGNNVKLGAAALDNSNDIAYVRLFEESSARTSNLGLYKLSKDYDYSVLYYDQEINIEFQDVKNFISPRAEFKISTTKIIESNEE